VLASESEAAVAENLLAVRSHRADAERRLAEGTATKSELLSWRMQEVEASVRTRSADADRAAARARLNVLLGRSWDAPLETAEEPTMAADGSAAEPTRAAAESTGAAAAAAPEGEASCPDGGAGESGLLATALGSRPELAAARARVEAREAAVGVARSALLPALHLTASAAYADPNPKAFPQRPGFELLWDIGLVASLDLGRLPFARSQVEEARAQAREARGALAQAQDGVALELALAGLELEKARDRLESSSAAVALAEENRRVQEERFAAGIALASELADAESALLLARLDGTRSRVAWELARAALRDAAGGTR
ncbi:MAG TPA: TolC family protein, partial [Spirochaetia bacterium]|nr:TolC family protein [Spirochaetia bacterium]